jgi:hypothetical protein
MFTYRSEKKVTEIDLFKIKIRENNAHRELFLVVSHPQVMLTTRRIKCVTQNSHE